MATALSSKDAAAVKKAGIAGGLSSSAAAKVVKTANANPITAAPPHASGGWKDPIRAENTPDGTKYTGTAADAAPQELPEEPVNPAVPPQVQNNIPSQTVPGADTITDPATGASFTKDAAAGSTYQPNKYQQGLQAAQSSNVPVPADAGAARTMAIANTPKVQDTTSVDNFISADPAIGTLMSGITQLLNPQKQSTTLLQDYQKLYKQSGLDQINHEIIDADTIINGTEDDIRNEIQGAGGLATESQVQAMALSRNKALLTRYNQLVQMKTDATNQLNTMSSLNAQDKQMAQQRVNTQIDAMFKLADFRQQASNNVKEAFNSMVSKIGYDGALSAYSKDPRQLSYIESIMGLGQGGLAKAAEYSAQERAKALQADALDSKYKNAQIANIYSEIGARNTKATGDATATADAQTKKIESQVEKAKIVSSKVEEAIGQIGKTTTGTFGGLARKIPGTGAYNLAKAIDTIQANIGFDTLQAMRDSSPTGGALGQVSEREISLLQSTIASLDTGQDAKTLESNLHQVEEHYMNWMAAAAPERLGELGYTITPDGSLVKITH